VDFEATCDDNVDFQSFPHEIIEFPVVVLNSHTRQVEHTFHSYVRPTERPVLSDFCKRLTGIRQDQVDAAPVLIDVLKKMFLWLKEIGIFEKKFIFVSHGPCDFGKFLSQQCERVGFHLPRYLRQFIDIKRTFREVHGLSSTAPCGIREMLGYYKMNFEGPEHSGLSDAHNVSIIVSKMIEEGIALYANDCIIPKNARNSPLRSPKNPKAPKSGPNSPKIEPHRSASPRLLESWLGTPCSSPNSPVQSPMGSPAWKKFNSPFGGKKKRATYDHCPTMVPLAVPIDHNHNSITFQSF